ncbi:MAG: hypothetical protein AB1631_29425 [Acidobacteriota bacterium]
MARPTADSDPAATSVFDARAEALIGSAFIDDRTLTGEDVSAWLSGIVSL